MKNALHIAFFFISISLQAQSTIKGKILSNKNRPLPGVSIVLKNTYDGATSDSAGNFSFTTSETGDHILEATLIGYRSSEQNLHINNSGEININLTLKELVTEMQAVVISAGSFEASDKNKGAVLNAIDIVTTASANGDLTSAFKSMPGTQQVGESEGLFVRGGTATESKIYMDGNLVNNFFYSSLPGIATRGRFNPFLFKGTIFSTGGYSALYGQALSSALILESKDLPDRTEADLSLSVVGIGGGIQKLAKNKRSSWGISYNFSNLWLAFNLIDPKQDFYRIPNYHEGDANYRFKTKAGGMIKYYGYISTNRVGFKNTDIDSASLKDVFSINNINTYQNINWKEPLGKGWKLTTGISYSTNKDDMINELQDANNQKQIIENPVFYAFKNFNLNTNSLYFQGRMVAEKKLKGLSAIRFGGDHFYSNEKSTYTLYDGNKFNEVIKDNLTAAFAEADIYLTNDLAAKIGGRTEHSQLMNQWNIAPRVSLAYKFKDNSQASLAYGIFYQNPERKYLPSSADLQYAQATHYIAQYQKLSKNNTFRAEVYYKNYDRLFKTLPNSNGREVVANNNGYGYAKGFELFWRDKKTLKNVDYWISYSYLDTKRDFLNYPTSIQPSFATSHTAAFVFKHFITPWKTQFNLSYNFATGRPYYRIAYDNNESKFLITDQGRTISYNNVSASVNYLPNIGKTKTKTFVVWVLSVNNILGQNQIYNYNYSYDGSKKVAITPPSRRFVFIGCFLSFGIDRTQDAINNTL